MQCPRLAELPPPPEGKTGWPWTVETPPLPPTRPDGSSWPRISIVTPSYNQGQFIEETIRSVLLQGYPDLEYIVMDGGSTDGSAEIIRKYRRWFAHWESGPDAGQAAALNKGLRYSTGDIFNWINSDDLIAQSALGKIAAHFSNADCLAGQVQYFKNREDSRIYPNVNLDHIGKWNSKPHCEFHQPGIWLRLPSLEGLVFNERFHYIFDLEFMVKFFSKKREIRYLSEVLVHFRLHDDGKTTKYQKGFRLETLTMWSVLRKSAPISQIKLNARKVIRSRYLNRQLTIMMNEPHKKAGLLFRFMKIVSRFSDVGLNRFTAGALLRILSPNRP